MARFSEFYGKDINQMKMGDERAFIGNYRTLGELKGDIFTQINDRKQVQQFKVTDGATLSEQKNQNKDLVDETVFYYQTASERFKNGKMKE